MYQNWPSQVFQSQISKLRQDNFILKFLSRRVIGSAWLSKHTDVHSMHFAHCVHKLFHKPTHTAHYACLARLTELHPMHKFIFLQNLRVF
jgi:hypothetical protein